MIPRSARAKDIFLDAVEIGPAEQRSAFLDEACAGDDELRRRVEALIAAHERPESLLDRAAVAVEATPSDPASTVALRPPGEGAGLVIGPYKLLEPIGEGGMGTVYMAEQHEPVRRRVALKVIKPGMDSKQVVARFEAERQALALMDHPNIAKVFDAGTTPEGRPYFVMELVKGLPITRFCDERRLTPRERLELFIPVCKAVQHAHQKGIIHRDIKPSNVLVALYDGRPVPKVIDFGVAKAIGQQLTEATLFTGFGAVVGTPEYMSPEQAELNQLDIDTRSDVYSLGVLLYELLTGSTPLDRKRLKEAALLEVLRCIRQEEPPRMSLRLSTTAELPSIAACRNVEPRKLPGLVRGELDWIVMKALEKDRSRRYETANALATDVRRFLEDEPVQACPPSAGYRLLKLARRNRAAVATVMIVAFSLITGTVISTWQAIRARRAERRAEAAMVKAQREEAIARAVNKFLIDDVLAQADPVNQPDRDLKLRTVLDRAAEKIEGQRFQDEPLVEAALRMTLGWTYNSLGEYQRAEPLLRRALELRRQTLGEDHPRTLEAMNALGNATVRQGRLDEARALYEKALDVQLQTRGVEDIPTFYLMNNLANVLRCEGRLDEARALYEKALDVERRNLGEGHALSLLSMKGLADVLRLLGRHDLARPLLERALEMRRRGLGEDHPHTLLLMHDLAIALREEARLDEARSLLEQTLSVRRRVLGGDHPDTLTTADELATTQGSVAWRLVNGTNPTSHDADRAQEMARRITEEAPRSANSWRYMGWVQYRSGDWRGSIASLERSMELQGHPKGGDARQWFVLAMAHWRLGHRSEARAWYDKAVTWTEASAADDEELRRFRAEAEALLEAGTDPDREAQASGVAGPSAP